MKDFVEKCIRTEAPVTTEIQKRLIKNARLLHAMMGMQTEPGEFTDALKKHIFYGKLLDIVNLKEEAADLLWYIGLFCDVVGCTIEDLQEMVIQKLTKRYPDKFTEDAAENRDLDAERKILEAPEQKVPFQIKSADQVEKEMWEPPAPPVHTPQVQKDMSGCIGLLSIRPERKLDPGKFLVLQLDHPAEEFKYAACMAARKYRRHIKTLDPKFADLLDRTYRAIEETMPPLKRPKEEHE